MNYQKNKNLQKHKWYKVLSFFSIRFNRIVQLLDISKWMLSISAFIIEKVTMGWHPSVAPGTTPGLYPGISHPDLCFPNLISSCTLDTRLQTSYM